MEVENDVKEFKLFPYQEKLIDEVVAKFATKKRVLMQADTGAGKTFCFSFLARRYSKVIILCHRQELITQTIDTLRAINVRCQAITSRVRKLENVQVYVAMVDTIYNRLEKGVFDFGHVDLVVADECHILKFNKVFEFFPMSNILGVTATPINDKRVTYFKCPICKHEQDKGGRCEHCQNETDEWSRPFTMSEVYDDIVVGPPIGELIEFGQLVPEVPFAIPWGDNSKLKIDNRKGDYSTASLNDVYGSEEASMDVLKNYLHIAKGKRTLVFNPSTKVNQIIYDQFKSEGLNVRMYDLTNTPDANRASLVDWFKNTDGAILLSVGVFTTGFDARTVEAIILNRATLSLSLFRQMVGRGGRSTDEIYKPNFILIDGGGNVDRFGMWSDELDWKDIFFNGKGDDAPKKKTDLEDVDVCENCGYMYPKRTKSCPECGFAPPAPVITDELDLSDKVAEPIRRIPPPNARAIISYTKRQNEGKAFAFRVLFGCVVDMFRYYRVDKEQYDRSKQSGELKRKVSDMVRPVYFSIINSTEIKEGANRRLPTIIDMALDKVEEFYS